MVILIYTLSNHKWCLQCFKKFSQINYSIYPQQQMLALLPVLLLAFKNFLTVILLLKPLDHTYPLSIIDHIPTVNHNIKHAACQASLHS